MLRCGSCCREAWMKGGPACLWQLLRVRMERGRWVLSGSDWGYSPTNSDSRSSGDVCRRALVPIAVYVLVHIRRFYSVTRISFQAICSFCVIITHPRAAVISLSSGLSAGAVPSRAWTFCFLAACFCSECLSHSVRMHKTSPSSLLWLQTLSWHLGILWCPHIVGNPLLASILPATEWPWETVCKKRAISKVTVKDSEPWFDLMALKLSDGMYSSWSKWGPQRYRIPQWLEKTDSTWQYSEVHFLTVTETISIWGANTHLSPPGHFSFQEHTESFKAKGSFCHIV